MSEPKKVSPEIPLKCAVEVIKALTMLPVCLLAFIQFNWSFTPFIPLPASMSPVSFPLLYSPKLIQKRLCELVTC